MQTILFNKVLNTETLSFCHCLKQGVKKRSGSPSLLTPAPPPEERKRRKKERDLQIQYKNFTNNTNILITLIILIMLMIREIIPTIN